MQQDWKNELDRPIYFVELREGYRCAWCQVDGSRLMLIPHPISKVAVQTFSLASEVEVLGQVVGMALRLASPNTPNSEPAPKLPKPNAVVK